MVSFLIPAYNSEDSVVKSIESVTNQSLKEIEIIVVDDCSTDNTYNLIKNIKDSRIKLFKNKKNVGCTKTLIKGLNFCNYNIIIRHDVDNFSFPDRTYKMYKKLIDTDSDLVFSGLKKTDNNNTTFTLPVDDGYLAWKQLFYNHIEHNVMFKKNSILSVGGYYKNTARAQDYELWLKLILKNMKITSVGEVLYEYTKSKNDIHDTDITNKMSFYFLEKYFQRKFNKNRFMSLRKKIREKNKLDYLELKMYNDLCDLYVRKNKNAELNTLRKYVNIIL